MEKIYVIEGERQLRGLAAAVLLQAIADKPSQREKEERLTSPGASRWWFYRYIRKNRSYLSKQHRNAWKRLKKEDRPPYSPITEKELRAAARKAWNLYGAESLLEEIAEVQQDNKDIYSVLNERSLWSDILEITPPFSEAGS